MGRRLYDSCHENEIKQTRIDKIDYDGTDTTQSSFFSNSHHQSQSHSHSQYSHHQTRSHSHSHSHSQYSHH